MSGDGELRNALAELERMEREQTGQARATRMQMKRLGFARSVDSKK